LLGTNRNSAWHVPLMGADFCFMKEREDVSGDVVVPP
jgi:hypothetical protein